MKRNGYRLFIDMFWLLLCSSLTNAGSVNNHEQLVPEHPLMTSRDIITHSLPSNITIQNKTGDAITVYGLYINQFADNSPPPNDCTSPTLLYSGSPPKAAGAFVSRVALGNNQKIELGANYLYNMIFSAIYYGNQTSSMPCFLPGCSWPATGSTSADTPGTKWCIYLGVLAPASGNSTTSNVPPMAKLVSDSGYNYDLVTQYGYIGPITCDDLTLTCSVSRSQNVPFPF